MNRLHYIKSTVQIEKEKINAESDTTIECATHDQIETLVEFQLKMAMETEDKKLDRELVQAALAYFIEGTTREDNDLGMFLVKKRDGNPIATLMLTFVNDLHWIIQSVFVLKTERRKGHFKELFQEIVKLGEQRNIKSIALYVETENERAQATYKSLGMHIIEEKMHTYDLVFGNFAIEKEPSSLVAEKIYKGKQAVSKYVDGQKNVLTGLPYEENGWNYVYVLKKEGRIVAVSKMFTEFSEWRFGIIWYFREIYIVEGENVHYQDVINATTRLVLKQSALKVGAIRVLYRESQNLKFEGGKLSPYYIMEINLR